MTPTLADLPPPPPGRTGWPWTEASPLLPPTRPDGSAWPRITIVTPSYNQGEFIEETIRSVLLQGYPNLEYIVMDGGSTDGTVATIRKYEPWLAHWRSEPDGGQAAAINDGLAAATGAIFQFINSDDVFCIDSFRKVGEAFADVDVVAGWVVQFSPTAETLYRNRHLSCAFLLRHHGLTVHSDYHQPGVFLDTEKLRSIGGFDASYRFVFDYVAMVRYLDRFPRVQTLDAAVARFRLHQNTKTVSEGNGFGAEFDRARRSFLTATLSDNHTLIADRVIRRQGWPAEVARLRGSAPSRRAFVASLARHAILDPYVSLNRFTLGAIRNQLLRTRS